MEIRTAESYISQIGCLESAVRNPARQDGDVRNKPGHIRWQAPYMGDRCGRAGSDILSQGRQLYQGKREGFTCTSSSTGRGSIHEHRRGQLVGELSRRQLDPDGLRAVEACIVDPRNRDEQPRGEERWNGG